RHSPDLAVGHHRRRTPGHRRPGRIARTGRGDQRTGSVLLLVVPCARSAGRLDHPLTEAVRARLATLGRPNRADQLSPTLHPLPRSKFGDMEEPKPTATPVIFIHGLFLHATSWAPWVDLFREAGYEPAAPGWPGDPDTVAEARANPDSIADHGIDDVVEHYAKIISAMPTKPILIGHSFGGMFAQKLLGLDLAAAAIAIDAAPLKAVLPVPLSARRPTPTV